VTRAALRFLAAVAATSGVLLITDAAVTLIWQEPVSALIAGRQQAILQDRLTAQTRTFARAASVANGSRRGQFRPARLAAAFARRIDTGSALGRLSFPTLKRSYVAVEGTDAATLRKGPGRYPKTDLPGQGGTVAVAGHRTTYLAPFRTIDRLGRGDPIDFATPYGRFRYRVENTRIVEPDAWWVTRDVGHERLVLTACHPLYSAAQRIVVFARLARAVPVASRGSAGGREN
jgi:sortase A